MRFIGAIPAKPKLTLVYLIVGRDLIAFFKPFYSQIGFIMHPLPIKKS